MDGNKDEAIRCVKIAKSAIKSGDKQRAIKFLKIAKRLDPNIPIKDLLSASETQNIPNLDPSSEKDTYIDRVHKPVPSNSDPIYTEEHVRVIREIRKTKDYYAILGVEKSCSQDEIKKAYRKLSLKVHPDKNKAPGAEEAFKSVSKAFNCLSNEQLRGNYDQTGKENSDFALQNVNFARRRARRRANPRGDFFDENFDPDEMFRSFFFGSQDGFFRAQNVYRTRGMGTHFNPNPNPNREDGYTTIFLVLVISVLFFFIVASVPLLEPEFALQKTYNYHILKNTEKFGVEYFVKREDFDTRFPQGSRERENLERSVLREYKSLLGRYCHVELQRRYWDSSYPSPYCDKLKTFGVA